MKKRNYGARTGIRTGSGSDRVDVSSLFTVGPVATARGSDIDLTFCAKLPGW